MAKKKKPATKKNTKKCYVMRDLDTGEVVTMQLKPSFVLEHMDVLRQITVKGKRYQRLVDRERRAVAKNRIGFPCQAKWPYVSDAMGVHPSQIKEAQAKLAKLGVRVNYTKDGGAIVENATHRKQLAEAMGLHDRNSYGGRGDARHQPYDRMNGFRYEPPE